MKYQDQQKQETIATQMWGSKGQTRVLEPLRAVVEGGMLSFKGSEPPPNVGTRYPFLALPEFSDQFLVPPIGPNQQEARDHWSHWVWSLMSTSWGTVRSRKGQRGDLEDRWRVSSAKPVLGDPERPFWAEHQRSYSRCPRISEVLSHSL